MALSKHHVPPKCYHEPETFVLKVPRHQHAAYHELLGIPSSYDEARRVLAARRLDYARGKLPKRLEQNFRLLFSGAMTREEDNERKLLEVWWTRKSVRSRS
jgi:hypothetical protein